VALQDGENHCSLLGTSTKIIQKWGNPTCSRPQIHQLQAIGRVENERAIVVLTRGPLRNSLLEKFICTYIYILYICGHQILSHGYINMMWVFYSIWEVLPLPGVAQMVKVGCSDQISKSCHCFLPLPIPFHRKPSVSTKCSIQSIKVSCIFYVSINTLYQPNGPSIPSR
jgi:hypothetical protein